MYVAHEAILIRWQVSTSSHCPLLNKGGAEDHVKSGRWYPNMVGSFRKLVPDTGEWKLKLFDNCLTQHLWTIVWNLSVTLANNTKTTTFWKWIRVERIWRYCCSDGSLSPGPESSSAQQSGKLFIQFHSIYMLTHESFVSLQYIIVLMQFLVTTAMNCQALICCMNVSYAVCHIQSILWVLIIFWCGCVKCNILCKADGLQSIVCARYLWEMV
jgi:hypothetical protein